MQNFATHGLTKVGRALLGLLLAFLIALAAAPATAATPATMRNSARLMAPAVLTAATTSVEQGAANWANSQTGSTSYEYLCLTFVYQAYMSAGFSRASLDAAAGWSPNSSSYPIDEWNYWAAGHAPQGVLHSGYDSSPPVGAIIYYSNRLGHDYSHATISLGGGQQISPDTTGVSGPQSVNTNSYRTMLGWWLPEGTDGGGAGDRDGDGTPDASDRCPDVAGPPSNSGCPLSTDSGGSNVVVLQSSGLVQAFAQGPNHSLLAYWTTPGEPWQGPTVCQVPGLMEVWEPR